MSMMRKTVLHHLPHEIITDILTRLPFEYVIRCKEVCTTWRKILHHIKRDKKTYLLFVGKYVYRGRTQLLLYYGEYDEKRNRTIHEQLSYDALKPLGNPSTRNYTNRLIVGSHGGLVCILMNKKNHGELFDYDDPIYICNPLTQETVRLPPPPPPQLVTVPKDAKKAWDDFTVIGFGYLYATNDYKIVRIYYNECSIFCEGQVQVYTLGDKSGGGWRNIGTTDHYLNKLECSNGILYDGALHWITNMGTEIAAFDLADEKFRSVPIPTCILEKYDFRFPRLLMLGGYLSVALQGSSRHGDCSNTEIWSLKPMKGSKQLESGHEFTIYSKHSFPPSICHPIALKEENNKVLLWDVGRGRTLCHFDIKTATLEEIVYENFEVLLSPPDYGVRPLNKIL